MKENTDFFWAILFVIALVADSIIISWAVFTKNSWLVYFMVIIALGGLGFLYRGWNKDERTDKAIDNSARMAIIIFVITASVIGSVTLFLSDIGIADLWQIGTTLIISVLFIAYTLLVLAVWNEQDLR